MVPEAIVSMVSCIRLGLTQRMPHYRQFAAGA
jgi:hypothetical protein